MAPLTPIDLGALAWWDAEQGCEIIGSKVRTWKDRVAGREAVAAEPSSDYYRPDYLPEGRNGKPGLAFSDDRLYFDDSGFPAGESPCTIFASGFFEAGAESGFVVTYGDPGVGQFRTISIGGGKPSFASWDNDLNEPSRSWAGTDRAVLYDYQGGTGRLFTDATPSASRSGRTFNVVLRRGVFGSEQDGGGTAYGLILQQVVVFDRRLTDEDFQKLFGWESWHTGKAGANLPAGHPNKTAAPASTAGEVIVRRRRPLILLHG